MNDALNELSQLSNLFGFGLFLDLPATNDGSTIVAQLRPINEGIKLASLSQLTAGLSKIGTGTQDGYIAFNLDIHRNNGGSIEAYIKIKEENPIMAYTVGSFGSTDQEPTLLYDIPLNYVTNFQSKYYRQSR